MSELDEGEVYAIIGDDGFARLVRAFYAQVPSDPVLGAVHRATSNSADIRACGCGTCRSGSTKRRAIGGWR
jgi:truncated hemoglobin YjbI